MNIKKLLLALAVFSFAMIATTTAIAQPVQKLADFKRVVVADNAPPSTKFGATELAEYSGRVAGTKVEVVPLSKYLQDAGGLSFFVGEGAAAKVLGASPAPWKTEEWMLKTVPQGLVLAGQDAPGKATSLAVAAGSQLAVYTLLDETLGVKWFWPGAFGEHVPSTPAATIPALDVRRTPEFIIRQYSIGYGSYHTEEFRDESAKWQRRTRQGWAPRAWFGHSWYDAFNFRDKGKLAQLVKEKPEWFALVNGKRQPPQMCTSNPEVIEHMVNFVLADTKNKITSISPSDGGGFCQCEKCRALDVPGVLAYDGKTPQLSDRIFTYANEIARRVREKDPDKGVGMFAYTFYNKPPIRIKKLEPNLYLSFVAQAMASVDPQVQADWKQNTEEWQKVSAHMIMREGWGNHYLLDLPFNHSREIIDAFSFASRRGFLAAYGEGSKAFSTQVPNSWAVTRMMWNPRQDTSHLMDDFYRVAYGPAANAMKNYFTTYEKAIEKNWPNRRFVMEARGMTYVNLVNSWHITFPEEVLIEAETHLKEAEAIAPQGEYSDRMKFHRHGFEYSRTLLELLRCYRQMADMGIPLEMFSNLNEGKNVPVDAAQEKRVLQRAYELGEKREELLMKHRDWAAINEGLYAFTNDRNIRQWHATVKKKLGIEKPTTMVLSELKAK